MTSKEKYLIDNFKLDEQTVKIISEVGRIARTHKYDVWIAKEFKKDTSILTTQRDLFSIIDWAKATSPNISSLSFEQALEESKKWHTSFVIDNKDSIKPVEIEDDNIIYICKDKKHFFLLLNPDDLKQEGKLMSHCVGGFDYKVKVNKGYSLLISLRDENNEPHVTIEVDTKTCNVVQMYGKANSSPKKEYLKMIAEFAKFASGLDDVKDQELIELIDSNFNKLML